MPNALADLFRPGFPLEVIIKGSLILLLALLAGRLWRRASASARHQVLGLAIAGTLLLPILVLVAPSWEVAPVPALDIEWRVDRSSTTPSASPRPDGSADSTVASFHAALPRPATRPVSWAALLTWIWLAGAALVCLRLLVALEAVGRVLRRATPVSAGPLWETALRCRRKIGLPRPVRLLIGGRATVPFTWGWRPPRIILPADCTSWSERKLTVVLLHEMAHIKRWDALVNLVTEFAAVVYWFNPLMWLTRRRLLVERECASDDCVLGAGIRGSEYAGYLMEIARVIRTRRWTPELQVAMARKTRLEERIMAIVTRDRQRSGSAPRWRLLVATLVALTLVFPLAGLQFFAQSDHEPAAVQAVPRTDGVPATPAELEAIRTLLEEFHSALYEGDDYVDVSSRFLTADYFDDPNLTFENWSQLRRDELMRNTMAHIRSVWGVAEEDRGHERRHSEPLRVKSTELVYRSEPLGCRQRDGEYYLTHRVNIGGGGLSGERAHLVRDLVQTIVFAEEEGALKIRRYDGGVNIQRMDVDNPHGPIFIVTLDGNEKTVPTGPMLFKSVPKSIVPNNTSMIPLRSDAAVR